MSKKTKYDDLLSEMRSKVQSAGSSRHSKADYTAVTQTLLNTPEQEVPVYVKDTKDPVITKPAERYRETLKPVLKQFGVDNAELDKIQDVQFSKEHAEALNDVAITAVKGYTSTGRKLVLPVTSPDESQMEISQVVKEEKKEDTRKLEQQADGSYKSVPTGERKTTKKHTEMKASNKIPGWLIEKKKI